MFPDATTLFADVITIAADLAIGHHRGPLSGRCKQGIMVLLQPLVFKNISLLIFADFFF